jgi:type IV pilus assembly protein PilE
MIATLQKAQLKNSLAAVSPQHKGFTLVELMVTVAIVAILASISYPSYIQYVIRSNRSEAQQFMLDVANREEEYFLNNRGKPPARPSIP